MRGDGGTARTSRLAKNRHGVSVRLSQDLGARAFEFMWSFHAAGEALSRRVMRDRSILRCWVVRRTSSVRGLGTAHSEVRRAN